MAVLYTPSKLLFFAACVSYTATLVFYLGSLSAALTASSTIRFSVQRVTLVIEMALGAMSLPSVIVVSTTEIVGVRDDFKVVRVDTVSVSAKMVGCHKVRRFTFWKRSNQEFVCPAVSEHFLSVVPESSVTVAIQLANPQPARSKFRIMSGGGARFVDLFKKQFVAVANILALHREMTPSGVWERAATNSTAPIILGRVW